MRHLRRHLHLLDEHRRLRMLLLHLVRLRVLRVMLRLPLRHLRRLRLVLCLHELPLQVGYLCGRHAGVGMHLLLDVVHLLFHLPLHITVRRESSRRP